MERIHSQLLKRHIGLLLPLGREVDKILGRNYVQRVIEGVQNPSERKALLGVIDNQIIAAKEAGVKREDRQKYAILVAASHQLEILRDMNTKYTVNPYDGRPGGAYGNPHYYSEQAAKRSVFNSVGLEGQLVLLQMTREVLGIDKEDQGQPSEYPLQDYAYLEGLARALLPVTAVSYSTYTDNEKVRLKPRIAGMLTIAEAQITDHFAHPEKVSLF